MIPNAPRLGDMPSGEPVPEAVYEIRCDKAEFKISKSDKHTPMAECMFTIFGPEEAEEFHGRKVFDNLMLAGEGAFRTRQLLTETGETDDFVLEDTDQLVGRECKGVIQIEKERKDPSTGQLYPARNKIARYMAL
jgi:hypothetical protein